MSKVKHHHGQTYRRWNRVAEDDLHNSAAFSIPHCWQNLLVQTYQYGVMHDDQLQNQNANAQIFRKYCEGEHEVEAHGHRHYEAKQEN